MWISENRLDSWVKGNSRLAQGVIVELVARLVAASVVAPDHFRFPLADSIGQSGPDGELEVTQGFPPFVPSGKSFWEIGTGDDPGKKATRDFDGLTNDPNTAVPADIRQESTFVFVTPLSGTHGWNERAQKKWLSGKEDLHQWKALAIVDGTILVDWLSRFPAVEVWLAKEMGYPVEQLDTPELHWSIVRSIGAPPPLPTDLFTANREAACEKLAAFFSGDTNQVRLDTNFPDQFIDFVSACYASLPDQTRAKLAGRCAIVSGGEAWRTLVASREKMVLIAEPSLDLNGPLGPKLLEMAKQAGHSVVFRGSPGGVPHPTRAPIPQPRVDHIEVALTKAGYPPERARLLSSRCDGNPNSLLRLIQNLSGMPEWASRSAAAELAIAELLGSWFESNAGDVAVVEEVSGKEYGEWIGALRDEHHHPGTPLAYMDSRWRFMLRYEGWRVLGTRIYNEHITRFVRSAVKVLGEIDPQFDLPKEQRFSAGFYGITLSHSIVLRQGIAEGLALLGSAPEPLSSLTPGYAVNAAVQVVREVLSSSDWRVWASVNDVMPLLAEASPIAFLDAVEKALAVQGSPFDELFAQESGGTFGATYMTGLLWALETLAWEDAHLGRVILILGELANRDPGGQWANRPINSLSTILLPWMPQTCASVETRISALKALANQAPRIGLQVLRSLLPSALTFSSGTRRPEWRDVIPEDWTTAVSRGDYHRQVEQISNMAVDVGRQSCDTLLVLASELGRLAPVARSRLLDDLESGAICGNSEETRTRAWDSLVDLRRRYVGNVDAPVVLSEGEVERLDRIIEALRPQSLVALSRHLFTANEWELLEPGGDITKQREEIERRRQSAIKDIYAEFGLAGVLSMARAVDAPWRVGVVLGASRIAANNTTILPSLLDCPEDALARFAGGFVWGCFLALGWEGINRIDMKGWQADQRAIFLSHLPFVQETWQLVGRELGSEDESRYWRIANVNPFEATSGLEQAIAPLVQQGRFLSAIDCLYRLLDTRQFWNSALTGAILLRAVQSPEKPSPNLYYEIAGLIKAMQEDQSTDSEVMAQVEWSYLPLLDHEQWGYPRHLEQKLASDPGFFCEIVGLAFKSRTKPETADDARKPDPSVASNAYRLLDHNRGVPGIRPDRSFDGEAFQSWLREVKERCGASGRLQVAMTMLGQILYHSPEDPGGLWVHRDIAAALNEADAEDMRAGFRSAQINSRGVHWVDPTGKPERELARQYATKAAALNAEGFFLLAQTVRSIAELYDGEADDLARRQDA